jgi:hypothetical protein
VIDWDQRPVEVANLLNPAFCAILLSDAASGYQTEDEGGMPYPLAFLVLPLVLHQRTRDALPKTVRTRMHVWLQDRPELRVGFAARVRSLVPYTKEALQFAMRSDVVRISASGTLIAGAATIGESSWSSDSEPRACRQRSQLLGRLLARAGDASTIYVMWGIRP